MDSTFNNSLDQMERQSEVVRGRILDIGITVENYISITLSDFFAKEDRQGLFDMYIMSDSLDFEKKKQILASLIKENLLELEGQYDSLSHDIQIIQDIRNLLAHTTLNTTKDAITSFDGSRLSYISFGRRKWQKEVVILLNSDDKDKEDLKNQIFSFSAIIDRANRLQNVLKF